jgi:hypothetical protein
MGRVLIGAVDAAPAWESGTSDGQPPGPPMGALACAVLVSRYPKMAARRECRGVLAVTTSGRSSAILTVRINSCAGGWT